MARTIRFHLDENCDPRIAAGLRLHGADVLATTVVQTCIRYEEAQRCRFCTIEESLRSDATVAVKSPAHLAEVAVVAITRPDTAKVGRRRSA